MRVTHFAAFVKLNGGFRGILLAIVFAFLGPAFVFNEFHSVTVAVAVSLACT
jgi:hypothetical protein